MKLLRKYAVIIGATGDIGMSITESVINSGYFVIATGRQQKKLDRLKNKFGKENINTYVLNLENTNEYNKFFSHVKNNFKKIEWLINSAGFIDRKESKLKYDEKIIKKTFLVNIESVIAITYLLLPIIKNGGGIVSISSTASLWGSSRYPIYSATKGALNIFAQSLAQNISKNKQSSIIICPGPTNTKMREKISRDAHKKQKPNIIGKIIKEILLKLGNYKNGDIILAQDSKVKIFSRL